MSNTGNSHKARAWRARQQDLINQGRFREAQQMDIDETRQLFGDKYDEAIQEMLDYTNTLNQP